MKRAILKCVEILHVCISGNLHFAYVKKEDERGDLFYACAMSNALEGNIRLGRKNKIEVDAVTPCKIFLSSVFSLVSC